MRNEKRGRRLTPEERYRFTIRKQEKMLEEYAAYEIEWAGQLVTLKCPIPDVSNAVRDDNAGDLIHWYKLNDLDIPDDVYRACAFFINKEFRRKAGSLTLLYEMSMRCYRELPKVTKENAFDVLSYRFKMYAKTLETGGY